MTFFGVLIAFGWLFCSSGMMGVLAGVYPLYPDRMIQQADWISFGLMVGLPLGIAMFRPVLDIILVPLQPIRFRIPGKMLVGMGLVAPFAVAWVLYDAWGFRNYEFLHVSLIFLEPRSAMRSCGHPRGIRHDTPFESTQNTSPKCLSCCDSGGGGPALAMA